MRFERLEARYIVPRMQHTFSLGDVDGLQRVIGPERDMVVLQGTTGSGIEAWSAIDTTKLPIYGSESTVEAWALVQELGESFVGKSFDNAREAVRSLGYLIDHPIFQAGFANLFIDAQALEKGVPLYALLGGTKKEVEVGVSMSKTSSLTDIEQKIVADKYRRIKVKVGPSYEDYQKIAQIRAAFPTVMTMIDANSSFDWRNSDHMKLLELYGKLDLLMIEQPLDHTDIEHHIALQQFFMREGIPGRICLDESIHTLQDAERAISGGIPIINIKVTRVGGLDIAQEMVERCYAAGVDTWVGGMMELTAPGKAHSLAMAAHHGVTLPSDISGTKAYFAEGQDPCVTPMERDGATIAVPQTVGRGWEVDSVKMEAITKEKVIFQSK